MVLKKGAQQAKFLSAFWRCYPVVLQHGQLLAQPASCLRSGIKGLYKAFFRPLFLRSRSRQPKTHDWA